MDPRESRSRMIRLAPHPHIVRSRSCIVVLQEQFDRLTQEQHQRGKCKLNHHGKNEKRLPLHPGSRRGADGGASGWIGHEQPEGEAGETLLIAPQVGFGVLDEIGDGQHIHERKKDQAVLDEQQQLPQRCSPLGSCRGSADHSAWFNTPWDSPGVRRIGRPSPVCRGFSGLQKRRAPSPLHGCAPKVNQPQCPNCRPPIRFGSGWAREFHQ